MQASSGGGCRWHSPHCATPAGTGSAQVRQRGSGGAKRATQASHTGRAGQLAQIAQRQGRRSRQRVRKEGPAMTTQYTGRPMPSNESTRRPPTIDAVAAARWARTPPPESSPWLHEEVGRRMEDRLQWIKAQPRSWADWSPLRGGLEAHALLARRYRASPSYVIEPEPALRARSAEALAAPWWSARRWSAAGKTRFGAEEDLPEEGV